MGFSLQCTDDYLTSFCLTKFFIFLLFERSSHRVDRRLGFFSSRPNWDPPPPHPQANVSPPPLVPGGGGGGNTLACRRGAWRGPNSDEGTDTVVL
jgi:hypothetical protein